MEDSFFGFDTSAPLDDDGGGRIAEPPEEEYDALNDETFGSAINGDWEEVHENLVLMDDAKDVPSASSSRLNKNEEDSDLEINLSGMKLDDVDIAFDDSDAGINLDPLVWANPVISSRPSNNVMGNSNDKRHALLYSNPKDFLREHFPTPFNSRQPPQQQSQPNVKPIQQQPVERGHRPSLGMQSNVGNIPKICTLEDIERSIITQQQQQRQHKHNQQQQRQADHVTQMIASTPKPKTPTLSHTQQSQSSQQLHQQQAPQSQQQANHHQQQHQPQQQHPSQPPFKFQFPNAAGPPPGFNGPRPNFNNIPPQHPLMHPGGGPPNHHNRHMPPGFPPVPIYPPGLPNPHPHPLTNFPPRPMANLPIALNNFAMHPNFNAMRPVVPPLVPPRLPPHPNLMNPNVGSASAYNMFNQRLVQEIQQNHPMLPNARHSFNSPNGNMSGHPHQQQQQQQHLLHSRPERKHSTNSISNSHSGSINNSHHQNTGGHHQSGSGLRSNGNLPDEYDEYANLMSNRDKQWLISIQLTQLNTDTPYIDDYYYTVFKERKAEARGDSGQSKTHKDNQLNHPLTQPKGHAQLILVSLGNKNGTNNRNGQNNRERRNSENTNEQDQQRKYVFTPLKFENSLGKLQYGSVTAPRKIIDMDIMGPEGSPQLSSNIELSAQRKSRHILLHIETLYRIVLKLEDTENPAAIATIVMKKMKETERLLLLEQMEKANKVSTGDEKSADTTQSAINPTPKSNFSYELEPREVLLARLIAGLTHDKVVAMMNVRKGKALIRRLMKHIEENPIRWTVWMSVFTSLQNVLKKDRDDTEGVLFALYPEFKRHIRSANFEIVVKISCAIPLNDKKSSSLFSSKFGISSLVCLILQAEHIYLTDTDETLNNINRDLWRQFLDSVATSLNRTIQNQTICAAIESDSIHPMMNHFARFKDLKLDSLLALISQAKQQIN